MIRNWIFWWSLVTFPGLVFAQNDPHRVFSQAKDAYDTGNYQRAISLYQTILNQNMQSAVLHYNLGNAYFRAGEIGESILHFEKAKKLKPRDEDIAFNLKVARARIQDRIDPPENSILLNIFNSVKYLLNLNELGWTVLVLSLITSVLAGVWWITGQGIYRTVVGYAATTFCIILVLTSPLLIARTIEATTQQYGIIISREVSAHSAPAKVSTELFVIHEGSRIEVELWQNGWAKIRLLDGKEGWIRENSIGII